MRVSRIVLHDFPVMTEAGLRSGEEWTRETIRAHGLLTPEAGMPPGQCEFEPTLFDLKFEVLVLLDGLARMVEERQCIPRAALARMDIGSESWHPPYPGEFRLAFWRR